MAEAMPSVALEAEEPDARPFGADTIMVDGVPHSRSDFEPVSVSTAHHDRCCEARHALRHAFRSRPGDALVAAELNVYYYEGLQRLAVTPDVMVVLGVPQEDRTRYRVWEERRPPSFVLEVLSRSTWRADLGSKQEAYARMGVREYFVLDGEGKLVDPPRLQGFRLPLGRRRYERMPRWSAAVCAERGAEIGYSCDTLALGIALLPGVRGVRFYDPVEMRYLATDDEDHVRAEQERQRAERERQRAEHERQRAEHEQALRLEAQAQVAALKRLLGRD